MLGGNGVEGGGRIIASVPQGKASLKERHHPDFYSFCLDSTPQWKTNSPTNLCLDKEDFPLVRAINSVFLLFPSVVRQ